MAWSQKWPLEPGDPVSLAHAQDLVDEYNARRPSFADAEDDATSGEPAWSLIARMRCAINDVLRATGGGGKCFYDFDTGRQFNWCGGDDTDDYASAFKKLFGESRRAWLNDGAGNEATGPFWHTLQCSTEDSDCYTFHFNELYQMIDQAMVWQYRGVEPYGKYIYKHGIGELQDTRAEAVSDFWSDLESSGVYTVTTSNASPQIWVDYKHDTVQDRYAAWGRAIRYFYDVTIPSDCVKCYLFTRDCYNNRYRISAAEPPNDKDKHPPWSLFAYKSTTPPDYDDLPSYWTFGTGPPVTLPCPDIVSEQGSAWPQYTRVELTGCTPGDPVYFQLHVDESVQAYLATSGYWDPAKSESRKSVQYQAGGVGLLWTKVPQD